MIDRSKERIKQTGEVFTPLSLVDEILSKLPEEVWQPEKTFIDPAAGDGNFLVRVVAWKIHKGSTPEQALQTTYGVDIMEDNVSHARDRVLTNAYAASKCHGELLPHLTHEQERQIGMVKGHDAFARKFNHIVERNIVCHDALTYDYSFSDQPEEPLLLW
jgi:hypothetical protein